MSSKQVRRRLLLLARPALRRNPKPPKARTLLGESFSTANYQGVLVLQHCLDCGTVQYPSREVCRHCLQSNLKWRETDTIGEILSISQLYHSQWEFFKRKVQNKPWPIATVKLAGQCLFVHLAQDTFAKSKESLAKGASVQVFSHSDSTNRSVLVAVSKDTPIETTQQRKKIMQQLNLLKVSKQ